MKLRLSVHIRRFTSSVLPKEPHKFYSSAFVEHLPVANAGDRQHYRIVLDKRALKTPMQNEFVVPSETLAYGVSNEWNAQGEKIKRSNMLLTALCNAAIDNPTQRSKDVIVDSIMKFLSTDTICYRCNDPPELGELQRERWDPVLAWAEKEFDVKVPVSYDFGVPTPDAKTVKTLSTHLHSFDDWSLVAIQNCVETLKSLILTLALCRYRLSPAEAVTLANLETLFQTERWGTVEWSHDLTRADEESRVAASSLFVHCLQDDSQSHDSESGDSSQSSSQSATESTEVRH